MDEEELKKILNRMGNGIVSLIGTARNLGLDYEELVRALGGEKMFKEPMQIRDRLTAVVRTKDGKIKLDENGKPMVRDTGWSPNGITNLGFADVAALILLDVADPTQYDYIAIGTGVAAFDPTQTTLTTETHREAGTGTRVLTAVANDTAQLVHTFSGYAGSEGIQESGVFNAAVAGTMLCRQTFAVLNIDWAAGDSLQITWRVQCKQGA